MTNNNDDNSNTCCSENMDCCSVDVDYTDDKEYMDILYMNINELQTGTGTIPVISHDLLLRDKLDRFKMRWDIKRDSFKIKPGIYAVGNPDADAPVLVSANYKLTFDTLRGYLRGMNAWIMIIDTKGINVWCAAGKGTFGTDEIIKSVEQFNLKELVNHRRLILPQLGAPGVAAYKVTKETGFEIIYGPVDAKDIQQFVVDGYQTTKEMRQVQFSFKSRIILSPVELVMTLKYLLYAFLFFMVYNWIGNLMYIHEDIIKSLVDTLPLLFAAFLGSVVVPALLPVLPFRAFALKGLSLGIIYSVLMILFGQVFYVDTGIMYLLGSIFLYNGIVAFLALNFTGSSTYTSFTGTLKETKTALPFIIGAGILGVVLIIADKVLNLLA